MRPDPTRAVRRAVLLLLSAAVVASFAPGCGGGSANTGPTVVPKTPASGPVVEAPDQAPVAPAPDTRQTNGTSMATGWKYRYDMISPPNSNFGVTTREVYLYFRPDTNSVGFRLENRLGVGIKIYWDESTFLDVYGRTFKAVHRGVNYDNKDQVQEPTYVAPGQTYADFLIPVDLLNVPTAAAGQGVKSMLPTDLSAQSMIGRIFGPTLVLGLENDVRQSFEVRFKVASVYSER